MNIAPEDLAKLLLELAELRKENSILNERIRTLESQVYGGTTK